MNNKHIACLILAIFCVLIVQGVSMVRNRATTMQKAAEDARHEANEASLALSTQRAILDDLTRKSSDLLAWLDQWEPHLTRMSSPESGEINITALIKEANLVLLAQRFEVVSNKTESSVPNAANATIPQLVRAHLSIEDDFIKSINWLGELESKLPIARVSNLELARGQSGNDVRMNIVVDIPLAIAREIPAPVHAP